jgi:pimeloyl-ACP methyl ester carboxylesterase
MAIILLGGMRGALGGNLPPAGFLLDSGFGVLQIDSRACARPISPVTLGAAEALDAAAGMAFLKSKPDVKQIGIFGFSMGAAAAVHAAAEHGEMAAVVAEGGYFNLGNDFVEPDRHVSPIHRVFLYTIAGMYWLQTRINPWKVSPIDDLPAISPRPVLLIYGEAEADSGRALAQFSAARAPKDLWIVTGGGHGSNYAASPEEYRFRILQFFNAVVTP